MRGQSTCALTPAQHHTQKHMSSLCAVAHFVATLIASTPVCAERVRAAVLVAVLVAASGAHPIAVGAHCVPVAAHRASKQMARTREGIQARVFIAVGS